LSKYSNKFKEEVVRKKLSGRPVREISKETGVADVTIYDWVKKFQDGSLSNESSSPTKYPIIDKYKLLTESFSVAEKDRGQWFRKNGVHPEHIDKWNNEIENTLLKPENYKAKYRELQEKNKKLERELNKKDKALAEAAVLLVLKKKYLALLEEGE
jgi:transposase